MNISAPIFIVGVGRSGSTVFHHVMTRHPSVAWLSRLSDRYPERPWLNRQLMRGLDLPLLGPGLARYFDPGESYRYWDHFFPGFSTPCRDLFAGDVPRSAQRALPAALAEMLTRTRVRPLLKITGWPRLGFLREIFPDAKFVHVLRDGRAVAASLLRVNWWKGWSGPDNWLWGELSREHQEEWERYGRSFVALAGIHWKRLMDATAAAQAKLDPSSILEIRYEEICADPVKHFRLAADFCELPWPAAFARAVGAERFKSENEKWKVDLSEAQQEILQSVLQGHLQRYGYR